MSEASARIGKVNRRILAVFWGLFGVACIALTLSDWFRQTNLLPYSAVVGVCFLASAVVFYLGSKMGRVAIGILVAPLSVLCFERLLSLHFQRYYGPFFWICFVVLAFGFYTWVFIFAGLDRDTLRGRYRDNHHHHSR